MHPPAREWLLTNGLGGYAMGTAAGVNTRRYHGLLVGAMSPPLGRVMGLSAVADSVTVGGERRELTGFRFAGMPSPTGTVPLSFECDGGVARWVWPGVIRELRVERGGNAADMRWRAGAGRLRVSPLIALRDFHGLVRGRGAGALFVEARADGVRVSRGGWFVDLEMPGAAFIERPDWWWNFEYVLDLERGQVGHEDLFCPGEFDLEMVEGRDALLEVLMETPGVPTLDSMIRYMWNDRMPWASLIAADRFVVRRDPTGTVGPPEAFPTVIAGYPWFSDWGRDTMISLPGLMLATGRHEEARETLLGFARMMRRGLIPNCFDNGTGEAEYNTVDASLWFVHACFEWRVTTNDDEGFERDLLPAVMAVIDAYERGTDFGIGTDPADGLVVAGDATTQLTWMDARRNGVVFTPRHGKPVEINALWYAANRRAAMFTGDKELSARADRIAASFVRAFWDQPSHCLFDCIVPRGNGWAPSREMRPNQIFAASLEYSPLSGPRRTCVVARVRERLLTPMGLRTLDPSDANYRRRYEGSLFDRDAAYHTGTVWPWLMGAYVEAVLRAGDFSAQARATAAAALQPLLDELELRGTLPEVYDAEPPRRGEGCPAQAWSVAEVLRANSLIRDATLNERL